MPDVLRYGLLGPKTSYLSLDLGVPSREVDGQVPESFEASGPSLGSSREALLDKFDDVLKKQVFDFRNQPIVGRLECGLIFGELHLPLVQNRTCVDPFVDQMSGHSAWRAVVECPEVGVRATVPG